MGYRSISLDLIRKEDLRRRSRSSKRSGLAGSKMSAGLRALADASPRSRMKALAISASISEGPGSSTHSFGISPLFLVQSPGSVGCVDPGRPQPWTLNIRPAVLRISTGSKRIRADQRIRPRIRTERQGSAHLRCFAANLSAGCRTRSALWRGTANVR